MGKKFRKKNKIKNSISPVKERNKIRKSILQVFKARLQSPGKGGALLVGKPAASPLVIDKKRNKKLQTLHLSSSSDIDSDSSSDYLMAKKKKAKCKRKTTKSNSPKTFDNPMMKHIKQLTEMDSSHPVGGMALEKHPEQKISFITQSRVTKCLGLFNRGRKSDKIARVAISMPESVQNKTNEDLKRVLNIKNTTSDNDSSEEDDGNLSNMVTVKASPSTITKANISEALPKGNPVQGKVTQKIPTVNSVHGSQSTASCITVSSTVSSCNDMEENLPTSPPIKEIASEMLSSLHPKRVLFSRNIRRERFNELQRLLMQSLLSSSPCSSTEKTKPASMIFTPKSFIKSTSLTSQGSVKVQTTNEIEADENSMNLSGINDAKSLLIQNDIHMKLDKDGYRKSTSTGKSPETDHSFQNLDEVAFNSNLDNNQHKHLTSSELNIHPPIDNHPISHAGDYAQLKTDKLKLMTCKKFFQCQQTEQNNKCVTSSVFVADECQQTEQNNKCVTSCVFVADEPGFRGTHKSVPGFSGDYVSPPESTIKRKQIYQTEDSLDFLEYLDQVEQNSTTGTSSSFWDSHQKFFAWNKTAALNDNISDSETSPLWVPLSNLPPPPTKPCLDSIPSPPEKLYPRKLY